MVPSQLRFYKEIMERIKDGAEYEEVVCLRDMMSKGPINPYEMTLVNSLVDEDRYIKRIDPA